MSGGDEAVNAGDGGAMGSQIATAGCAAIGILGVEEDRGECKGRDIGTIEPGKLADIIVVKGNPLYDVVALKDVLVVMKDGILHKGGPHAK